MASGQQDATGLLAEVQELWNRNRRKDAIVLLLERINSRPAQEQRPLVLQLVGYVRELGDRPGAERLLQQLLTLHPADSQIKGLLQELRQEQGTAGASGSAAEPKALVCSPGNNS
jgi:predicted Zn-dependent protease